MKRAKLIVAPSDTSADMLYATKFRAPDAFIFVRTETRSVLLLSDLEVDRGRQQAKVDEVLSYSQLEKEVQGTKKKRPSQAKVIAALLKGLNAVRVEVPADFPFSLARELRKEEIKLKPAKGFFWPQRETKTAAELKALTVAEGIAEAGMARGLAILRESTIRKDGKLQWNRKVLRAEALRQEMEIAVLRAGGEARGDTIVACGEQACDPHERGHGPLSANQLIILDIFPRDARTGYFGDLTRTVVKGKASDAQRHIWETCLHGQRRAFDALKPGADGMVIHEGIKAYFAESGYPTEIKDGRWHGFFHGTGHGLGLEIHEAPRFGTAVFKPGLVVTVEPGIYIPGLGGVRHEDVVTITKDGYRLLSSIEKPLEV